MQQVIIAIHLMVVSALVIVILYQKSEGGALGMGQSGVFTGRGQANALTRATGILATIFFLTSIALTVLPAWQRRADSGQDWTKALDQGGVKLKEVNPDAKAGDKSDVAKDTIFDQLQRAQQQRLQGTPETAAPAMAPEAPKTGAPAKPEAPNGPGSKAPQPR
jgi:protein translocase SecG subunit